jgi:hypothetical protein
MGYGDALMISALAKNFKCHFPDGLLAVAYTSSRYWRRKYWPAELSVFRGNSDIDKVFVSTQLGLHLQTRHWPKGGLIVDMKRCPHSYVLSEDAERIKFVNRHAVAHICEHYGIPCYELDPVLQLDADEVSRAETFMNRFGLQSGNFVVISPDTKDADTLKAWPRDHWLELIKCLQVDFPGLKIVKAGHLPGAWDHCVNTTGSLSFRELAHVIARSVTLITTEGGVMHLARAVKKRSIVMHSGWLPKAFSAYPENVNLHMDVSCSGCGLKVECPHKHICMTGITPKVVLERLRSLLMHGE